MSARPIISPAHIDSLQYQTLTEMARLSVGMKRRNCVGVQRWLSFHGSLPIAPALLSLRDVVTGAVLLLLSAIDPRSGGLSRP
jgi:hypothetical protein